jgi:hypothetical protein
MARLTRPGLLDLNLPKKDGRDIKRTSTCTFHVILTTSPRTRTLSRASTHANCYIAAG